MDRSENLTQGPTSILKEEIYKLILLGASGVGKTSLARRFANLEYDPLVESTIGCAFLERTIHLDDTRVEFRIWDTAGQERYNSLIPMYCRGAHAAVIVYDITKEETFQCAMSWVEEAKEQAGPNIVVALAGNKADRDIERAVDYSRAMKYAAENGLLFIETSALAEDISGVLLTAIAEILPRKNENQQEDSENIGSFESSSRVFTVNERRNTLRGCCYK